MKRKTLAVLAAVTILLPSCSKKTEGADASPMAAAATATAAAASPSASTAATAYAAFSGKLAVAMVRGYTLSVKLSDPFDARVASVAQHLGPPTRKENGRAFWAATDADQCSSLWIAEDGSGSSPSNVAKKDFGEQWGKYCLLMAGVSPARKPFTGKVLTPSTFGKQGSWQQVRVEGLLGDVTWQQTAARYSFTLIDAKDHAAKSKCTMEMGAAAPKATPKSPVVVECSTGGGSSTGAFLSDCFVVEK
jgi:hypothetical protein